MDEMQKDKKICQHCLKPGGRVVTDPYSLEVNDEKVKMRLHKKCEQRRIEGI